MSKLPSNWQVKSLGEVAEFINGRAFKPEEWGTKGLPIIRIQNLTGFSSIYNYFDGDVNDKNLVRKNDILISWSASLGVYVWNGNDAVLNQHIFKVELKNDIDRIFFYYLIKTKIDEMIDNVHGSTMKHITKGRFDNIKVKLPPLLIQKQIAEILEKADEAKQKRKEANKLTDEFLQSVFIEMFGDPVKNPKGFPIRPLEKVCFKITDGTHNSPKNNEKGTHKYITAKNIKRIGFDLKNITYISELDHKAIYSRCNPEFEDVLYIKDGVTTGIAQVNTLKEEFSMLSSLALFKLNKSILNPYYLRDYLNNEFVYQNIRNSMGGAAITRLTVDKLKRIQVFVTPLSLQQQFAVIVNKT
ncbi:MAG: restriction endonuclease subunit S, partial [Ignavibacteria bacterium]|nr:restriction endonuclease subunit S [Ignavibacteria bacterium]